jgi:hypothetical protein
MNCNVNICAHNKNGECIKKDAKIELCVDNGLTAYCDGFEKSLSFMSEQYKIYEYGANTVVILIKDPTINIVIDIPKIKSLIKEQINHNIDTIYFDMCLMVGKNASNRIMKYYLGVFSNAEKDMAKSIKAFIDAKYPNLKKY